MAGSGRVGRPRTGAPLPDERPRKRARKEDKSASLFGADTPAPSEMTPSPTPVPSLPPTLAPSPAPGMAPSPATPTFSPFPGMTPSPATPTFSPFLDMTPIPGPAVEGASAALEDPPPEPPNPIASYFPAIHAIWDALFPGIYPVQLEDISEAITQARESGYASFKTLGTEPLSYSVMASPIAGTSSFVILMIPPTKIYQGEGSSKHVKSALFEFVFNPTENSCTCTRYVTVSRKASGIYRLLNQLLDDFENETDPSERRVLEEKITKEREKIDKELTKDGFSRYERPSRHTGEMKVVYTDLYRGENVAGLLEKGVRFSPDQIRHYFNATTQYALERYRQYRIDYPDETDKEHLYLYLLWDRKPENLLLTPEGTIIDHDFAASPGYLPITEAYLEKYWAEYSIESELVSGYEDFSEEEVLRIVFSATLVTMLQLLLSLYPKPSRGERIPLESLLTVLWGIIQPLLPPPADRNLFERTIATTFEKRMEFSTFDAWMDAAEVDYGIQPELLAARLNKLARDVLGWQTPCVIAKEGHTPVFETESLSF